MIGLIFLYNFNTFLNGLIITLVAVLVFFLVRLMISKRNKTPEIEIKLRSRKKWKKERHFRGEDSKDPDQDFHNVHVFFQIIWNFEIVLKNSAWPKAYYVRLLQAKENHKFSLPERKIDPNLIFEYHQKELMPISFTKTFRVKRSDKDLYFTELPHELDDLSLLIEYSNVEHKMFYRTYFFKDNKTVDVAIPEADLDDWEYI